MYTLITNVWDWIVEVFNNFEKLWNSSFQVGDYSISFQSILTTSLLLIVGMLLVKKLI